MSVNKKYLLNHCIPFGLPYKLNNIKIYPLSISDYYIWEKDVDILNIEKNFSGSAEVIQMSYLKFLFTLGLEDKTVFEKLIEILHKALRLEDNFEINVTLSEEIQLEIESKDETTEIILINESMFEDIRTIILYQTIYGYDDRYINPDVKEAVDEYHRLKAKGSPVISLERKVAAMLGSTSYSFEEINKMPIRTFFLTLDTLLDKSDYQLMKGAELRGTTFKQTIEHWFYKQEKDKYTEGFVDYDDYNQTLAKVQ